MKTHILALIAMTSTLAAAEAPSPSDASISTAKAAAGPFPGTTYGRIELRQYSLRLVDEDNATISEPARIELRPILGAKLYGGLMDIKATFGLIKKPPTEVVDSRRPELEATLDAFKLDFGTTRPYARSYLPHDGSPTETEIGLRQLGTVPTLAFGNALELVYELEACGVVLDRAQDAKITNGSGRPASEYGLKGEEKDGTVTEPEFERNMSYRSKALIGSMFKPGSLPALSLGATVAARTAHTPKYELNANGKVYSSFARRTVTENRLLVSYKASPRTTLVNELFVYADGLEERPRVAKDRSGKPAYENILRLEYALF